MLRRRSARLATFPAYLDVFTAVICLLGYACVGRTTGKPIFAGAQLVSSGGLLFLTSTETSPI